MADTRIAFRINSKWQGRLLIVAALYLTFIGGRRFVTELNLWPRIVHHLLMTLLVGGWLLHLRRSHKFWPSTPLDGPIAVFFLVNVLSTVFAADPRVSVEELWRIGLQILLFYMIVDLTRSKKPRAVFLPLFFASSVVILISFFELLSWYAGIPPLPFLETSWLRAGGLQNPIPPAIYRLGLGLSVSTLLSGYMAVLIPIGLAWAISSHADDTRRGMVLWVAGAVVVEIFTFSRGGLLALAISIPLFSLLSLFSFADWRERLVSLARQPRVRMAVGGLILLIAFVGGLWLRQQNLEGHRAGDVLRLDLWRSAWRIGSEHPILGVGRYGFGRAFREVRDPWLSPDFFTTPDNYLLLIWAETGLFGVLSFSFLAATVILAGLRTWRQSRGNARIRAAAALAALCGYMVHNLFDAIANVMPVLIPALVLVAYLLRDSSPTQVKSTRAFHRLVPTILLIVVGLAQVGWIVSDIAQVHFRSAIAHMDQGDLTGALNEIDTAVSIDPAMGLYAAQRAQILGEMAFSENRNFPRALDAYETALRFEDSYDLIQANYGQILAQQGLNEQALEHFRLAQEIRPTEARYWLLSAELAEKNHDPEAAANDYDHALEQSPGWIVSDFWSQTQLRMDVRSRYLATHGLAGIPRNLLAAIPTRCWDRLEADSSVDLTSPYDYQCAAEIMLHDGGDPSEAVILAQQAVDMQPDVGLLRSTLAEAYLAAGSKEEARREAEIAVFLGASRGNLVLGRIEAQAGNESDAIAYFVKGGPVIVQWQGWDVAVYGRLGNLRLLESAQFDAPGPTRYDVAAWLELLELYDQQGRVDAAAVVRDAILALDPYFVFNP